LLHFHGSDVLSALQGSIELLRSDVSLHSLIVKTDSFKNLGRTIVPRNVKQTFAKQGSDLIDSVLGVLHGQVEAIVPDFLELVFVAEVVFGDLKVAADSLLPITVVFPLLGALKDLLPGLVADLGSA
jgi:hypothetical protein